MPCSSMLQARFSVPQISRIVGVSVSTVQLVAKGQSAMGGARTRKV